MFRSRARNGFQPIKQHSADNILNCFSYIMSFIPETALSMTQQVLFCQMISMSLSNYRKNINRGLSGVNCHPSQRWLGLHLSRSRQTINQHIRVLTELGLIISQRRGKRQSNLYSLGKWVEKIITKFNKCVVRGAAKYWSSLLESDVRKTRQLYEELKERKYKEAPLRQDLSYVERRRRILAAQALQILRLDAKAI